MVRLLGLLFVIVGAAGGTIMAAGALASTNVIPLDILTSGPIYQILHTVGALIAIISPVFLVVGGGLLLGASWARPLAFAVAMMSVFSFPVGTVLALITFLILSRPEAKAWFQPSAERPVDRVVDVERTPSPPKPPDAALPAIASVTYDIGVDDLVAFAEYHGAHSSEARRNYYWSLAVGAVAVIGMFWVWGMRAVGGWAGVGVALVGWVVYLNWRTQIGNRRYYRRVYSEEANRGMLGPHRLSADAEGLSVATNVTEARTRWSGVERIEEAPGLAIVYVGSLNAYTVPEARVIEGNFREFVATVRRLHANAHGGAPENAVPASHEP